MSGSGKEGPKPTRLPEPGFTTFIKSKKFYE